MGYSPAVKKKGKSAVEAKGRGGREEKLGQKYESTEKKEIGGIKVEL